MVYLKNPLLLVLFFVLFACRPDIDADKLTICFEPEVASLYCCHLPVGKSHGKIKRSLATFLPSTVYMVLDAGGGTVDVTVHKIMENGYIRELHKASGGTWGGTRIDDAFENLLIRILDSRLLPLGATVAITLGSAALVLTIMIICFCKFYIRKKRRAGQLDRDRVLDVYVRKTEDDTESRAIYTVVPAAKSLNSPLYAYPTTTFNEAWD